MARTAVDISAFIGWVSWNVQFNNSGSFGGSNNFFWDNSNNRLGIMTTAPTSTLTFGSTSTWIAIFNTVDQTTNYERMWMAWWASSVFSFDARAWWSGTASTIRFNSWTSSTAQFDMTTGSSTKGCFDISRTTSWASIVHCSITWTSTASSGVNVWYLDTRTFNQTSTAGYVSFWSNVTETAVWSWGWFFLRYQVASSTRYSVNSVGKTTRDSTITAGGTTGNRTIDKASGTVNFAAAATAITVTCNQCTTSSIVFAVVRTNDTTAVIKNVVPWNGSFVITLSAAATAETSVWFMVYN